MKHIDICVILSEQVIRLKVFFFIENLNNVENELILLLQLLNTSHPIKKGNFMGSKHHRISSPINSTHLAAFAMVCLPFT